MGSKNTYIHNFFGFDISGETSSLYREYIINLLSPIRNLPEELREMYSKTLLEDNKKTLKKTIKLDDLNNLFNKFVNIKFNKKSKRFDSFILPTIITRDRFYNRSPMIIIQEEEEESYKLLKNILVYGFPIVCRSTNGDVELYIFYIDKNKVGERFLRNLQANFYLNMKSLSDLAIKLSSENYLLRAYGKNYYNTLLFIIKIFDIISTSFIEDKDKIYRANELIVWKKATGRGFFSIFSDLKYIFKFLEKEISIQNASLVSTLENIFWLKKYVKEEIIYDLLDKFSYSLLKKHTLDVKVINTITSFYVKHYREISFNIERLKNLRKIIEFMEEATKKSYEEYFQLGQIIRKRIWGKVVEMKDLSNEKRGEIFEKIIDRFSKDLRNEEQPGFFANTFVKNLIRLKDLGIIIDKELSSYLQKLSYELRTCNLSDFYLIKSAIILGLISPSI